MILTAARMLELYRAVKSDKHQSEDKSVLIFVANGDVDSLCTCVQLENMLGKSDISSSSHAVENYSAISAICEREQLDKAEELKTVFMINCGATEDIRSVCKFSPNVRVIIIDSHRPIWHGYNTEDQEVVVVVDDDDPVAIEEIPEYRPEDDKQGSREADDVSDSEDESDEGQSDDIDSSPARQGRDNQSSQDMEVDTDAGNASDHNDDDDDDVVWESDQQRGRSRADNGSHMKGSKKRPAAEVVQDTEPVGGVQTPRRVRKQQRLIQKEEEKHHRQAVEEYYLSKAGYGKPSALLLLNLIRDQQEDDNFHIWLAILGITDQYIHQRMDLHRYRKWRAEMESHVLRHYSQGMGMGGEGDDDDDPGVYNNVAKHKLWVRPVSDFKIPLLRFWNLFDALKYTHHVATRMQTWRDVGVKQLELFLTSMHITPSQRNAEYLGMHPEVMPQLEKRLEQTSGRFKIAYDALKYRGFEMQYKNDMRILATDYVLAVTAMLGRSRSEGLKPQDIFRQAMDCLYPQNAKGWEALQQGLAAAKKLASTIVEEGGLIITRGQIQAQKISAVWSCDLSQLALQKASVLEHPSALLRLAFFLRDMKAQRLKTVKPMVVIGPAQADGMCYVVAVRAAEQAGVFQNNPFSVPFQEALRDMSAGEAASMFTFDNAVFLIKRSLAGSFLDELRSIVQAYKDTPDVDARLS